MLFSFLHNITYDSVRIMQIVVGVMKCYLAQASLGLSSFVVDTRLK